MERDPIVAGQFYPAGADALDEEVRGYLAAAPAKESSATLLAMCPHAGYVYSGAVAGLTLGQACLAPTLLLLGPNHTGRGARMGVWNKGRWLVPGGACEIEAGLAEALLDADPRLVADTDSHRFEHSIEVLLPFLRVLNPAARIVPICVAETKLETLVGVGKRIAAAIAAWDAPVSILVSSDMSHYVSHAEAERRDRYALDKIEEVDPEGLHRTVRQLGITMCGAMPMTLALAACRDLGADQARITAYATSASVSGDYDRVVAYAGALIQV